ncbi:MAG: hypothetical protein ACU0BB_05355 [Paracoccaceae bacterium]|jgi:hypothetical protein
MTTSNDTTGCTERSQKLAILGGAVLGVLSWLSTGLFVGIGVGVVSWVLLRTVLVKILCPEGQADSVTTAPAAAESAAAPEPVAETASEPAPDVEELTAEEAPVAVDAPAEESAQVAASTIVKPSKSLPGQEELAARKGTWKYKGNPAS